MEICPRCGTRQLQDIRTWRYVENMGRHLCPVCVFEGAQLEDTSLWRC